MSRGNRVGCPQGGLRGFVSRVALLLALIAGSDVATASYPGLDGEIAYSDVVDRGTETERTAIFIAKQGQLTQPVARIAFQSDNDSSPAWSPDGELLAFVRRAANGPSEIYVVRRDGTDLRRVFSTSQFQGSNANLLLVPMQSIRWLASGDAIRFKLVNIVQSFVVGGVRTGTDRPAGASQQVAEGFDEGPSGTVTGCPLNASQLCELIEGGGTRTWELRFEGQPLIVSGGFAWWPKKNRNKVAFRAFLSGSSGPALYSATWDPTERFIAPKVERLDPLTPGTVTCVDPQTLAVSNSPKYIFGAIAPSPSGRFLTIARTELTPQTDDQDCVFVESSTLLVLRETGFSQGEMASGSKIGGIAWQPDPANLEVIVIQNAERSLDGLKVELRDFTDRESIVAGSPQRGIDGRYFFEALPGTYVVRATLEDAEGVERGLGKAFEVIHGGAGEEAAWIEFRVDVEAGDFGQTEIFVFGFGAPDFVRSNLSGDLTAELTLNELALIYFHSHRFVDWARSNLVSTRIPTVQIRPFTGEFRGEPFDAAKSSYRRFPVPTVLIGTLDALGILRDDEGDSFPENGEWHELSHHLIAEFVNEYACPPGANHGGFARESTCDSLQEGLAAFFASRVLGDGNYAGVFDLEENVKSWGIRFVNGQFVSTEDLAVAALLWDLVDADQDWELTQSLDQDGDRVFTTYTDRVSMPLRTLWDFLVEEKPRYVRHLVVSLEADLANRQSGIDIDEDGDLDAYDFEMLFLMHGFFPIIASQTVDGNRPPFSFSLLDGRAPFGGITSRIGRSDRLEFDFHGVRGEFVDVRFRAPSSQNSQIDVRVVDASGTPLDRAEIEWTLEHPDATRTRRQSLVGAARDPIPFELPIHFQGAGYTASEIPPCDPANDYVVDVTLRGSVNGFPSADAPTFDNCTYLHAVVNATAPPALTLTLQFPEDSAPPVTTPIAHSLAPTRLYGPILGDWALGTQSLGIGFIPASWTLELACTDPVVGGFAAGCSRIEYSLDGAPFVTYDEELDITTTGLHSLAVRSVDGAGNVESPQTFRYGISPGLESNPPVTTATPTASVPPVGNVTVGRWNVTLTCADAFQGTPGSGCLRTEFSVDGAAFSDYAAPVVIASVGTHVLRYRSYDVAGNVESIRQQTLVVAIGEADTTPPRTSIGWRELGPVSIADSNTAMGGFTIHQVACVDPGVAGQIVSGCARTEYRLDGGPLQPFVPPISITTPGIHTLDFGSVDVAGNDEVVKTEILTVVAPSDLDGDGLLGFGDNCDRAANPDQRDTDRDCIGNRCDADFNQNGVVDSSDASLLKARLGQSAASFPDQDLDGDGTVGVGDTTILRALFRQPPGPSWGLPYDVVIQWCE